MKLSSILKRFDFWQLVHLSGLMIQRPLRIISVLRATQRTMSICNTYYTGIHHQNGPANAFRHALWNILICQKVYRITKDVDKSMLWAEKVTNLHEKLAPNSTLATTMDLHNNRVGRRYFLALKDSTEAHIICFLQEKTADAQLVSNISQIDLYGQEMVYVDVYN